MNVYDLIIVGGGPVGLFAAFYAGRRHMKTLVIEAADTLGGLPYSLYSEKWILDVPGFSQITGYDLSQKLIEQAQSDMLTVMTSTQVLSCEGDLSQGFIVSCQRDGKPVHIKTASLLLATGMGKITPRKMNVPGEDRFFSHGLDYSLRSLDEARGKRVVITGGGDSALDWADMLDGVAAEVRLVHRREDFRAQEESVRRLKASGVILHLNSQITSILGDQVVEGVEVLNDQKIKQTYPCDKVIVSFGAKIQLETFTSWGLCMEEGGLLVNNAMETNKPGIFAAGDVVYTPGVGSTKLIAIGFAQGVIAVNTAKTRIDPQARFFPGHSTAW